MPATAQSPFKRANHVPDKHNMKVPKEVQVLHRASLPDHLQPTQHFLGAGGQGIVMAYRDVRQNLVKAVKEILVPNQEHLDSDLIGIMVSRNLKCSKFLAPEAVYYSPSPLNLHSDVWPHLSIDQQEQYSYREERAAGALYVVMPTKKGDSLYDFIAQGHCFHSDGTFKGLIAELLLIELVLMLYELNQHRICHGDIKPENLAVTANKDKREFSLELFDFGHATPFDEPCPIGTPMFAAPEVVRGPTVAAPGVDMYAAGVVLYTAVLGDLDAHPFGLTNEMCWSRDDVLEQLDKVPEPQIPEYLPFRWRNILRAMLHQDPKKRCSVQHLASLVHPRVLYMVMQEARSEQELKGLQWIQVQMGHDLP